jgi:hypothetical protein
MKTKNKLDTRQAAEILLAAIEEKAARFPAEERDVRMNALRSTVAKAAKKHRPRAS